MRPIQVAHSSYSPQPKTKINRFYSTSDQTSQNLSSPQMLQKRYKRKKILLTIHTTRCATKTCENTCTWKRIVSWLSIATDECMGRTGYEKILSTPHHLSVESEDSFAKCNKRWEVWAYDTLATYCRLLLNAPIPGITPVKYLHEMSTLKSNVANISFSHFNDHFMCRKPTLSAASWDRGF